MFLMHIALVAVFCILIYLALGPQFSIAILTALYVARDSFQSAAWVYANDPRPDRGKICAIFHVSVGIWMGAPTALVTLGMIAFLHHYFKVPLDLDRAHRALLSLVCAIGISSVLGAIASVAAYWKGVRVWVNRRFLRALAEEQMGRRIRSNYGIFVTATSLTLPALVVLAFVLQNEVHAAVGVIILPGTILFVLVPLFWLSSRIFATSPMDYLDAHTSVDSPVRLRDCPGKEEIENEFP